MGQLFSNLVAFIYLVGVHWGAYVLGGAPWAADEGLKRLFDSYARWSERNKPVRRRIEIAALLGGLLFASFQAWEEEYYRESSAKARIQDAENASATQRRRADDDDKAINSKGGYKDQIAALQAALATADHKPQKTIIERIPVQSLTNYSMPNSTNQDADMIATISSLMKEGQQIADTFAQKDDAGLIAKQYPAWEKKVDAYLSRLPNPSYSARFETAQGNGQVLDAHSAVGDDYWATLNGKNAALGAILAGLHP
ncbi:MAG TPA: hypothetical protein VK759_03160 [Rhizomicrobium sp.]|nr:hypothetical protein [Rhizomicrobium sp.]